MSDIGYAIAYWLFLIAISLVPLATMLELTAALFSKRVRRYIASHPVAHIVLFCFAAFFAFCCSFLPRAVHITAFRFLAMKAKITPIILLLSAIVFSGCSSAHFNQQTLSHWIPPGTPQADAIETMKQHGYESGACGRHSTNFCFTHETKILKNTRWFFVHFDDGKVASIYGLGTGNEFFDFLGHGEKSGI
jgi:hypothetical protein